MLSLPQLYGFYVDDKTVEMDRIYKPLALSNQAMTAAFKAAEDLRTEIFSDDAADWDNAQFLNRASRLEGMEDAFCILGIMEDYFRFLRK